ncbi:glycine receptor subunit alpha-2-like [Lineus longissimus]|uniref:glycine receptor subunit alpha-2-like n=1 Tax=Lineus longissimus TaxID=88925 RepID=UPI002B4E9682
MALFRLLLYLPVAFLAVSICRAATIQTFLDTLLKGYDKRIKPDAGKTTYVSLDMFVQDFSRIDTNTMDYHVSVFFRQRWRDSRLAYTAYTTPLTLGFARVGEIWVPDSFFNNEKTGIQHAVTVPNKLLRIYPDGEVLYSQRVTLKLACVMDLTFYPMDAQKCRINVETYGYTSNEMMYVWYKNSDDAVQFYENITLPEYAVHVDKIKRDNCTVEYITGTYSCLSVEFYIKREIAFFVTQTFIPSILIVFLSFVSFCIDVRAVPARVFIGLITILTITTMNSGITKHLPKVSYTKAIDVWMAVCLVFVFMALVEFSFANHRARQEDQEKAQKKEQELKQKTVGVLLGKIKPKAATVTDDVTDPGEVKFHPETGGQQDGVQRYWTSQRIEDLAKWLFPLCFIIFNVIYWLFYGLSSHFQ